MTAVLVNTQSHLYAIVSTEVTQPVSEKKSRTLIILCILEDLSGF